jgi:hypothetical protein
MLPFRRRLKKTPTWIVEIFYPICPAIAEAEADDSLDALKSVLRTSLAKHGLNEADTFQLVLGVLFEEDGWFRVRKSA